MSRCLAVASRTNKWKVECHLLGRLHSNVLVKSAKESSAFKHKNFNKKESYTVAVFTKA